MPVQTALTARSEGDIGSEFNLTIESSDTSRPRIVPGALTPSGGLHAGSNGVSTLAEHRVIERVQHFRLEGEAPTFGDCEILGDCNVVEEPVRPMEIDRCRNGSRSCVWSDH